ncbi:hypothetical protein BSLG_010388 [Batrachochytrium salamandrivorans]|nr:hypothetical protein BSLG_010388 [Batrachochytrium salamandrivorans]
MLGQSAVVALLPLWLAGVSALRMLGDLSFDSTTGSQAHSATSMASLSVPFHSIVNAASVDEFNSSSASISAASASMVFYQHLLALLQPKSTSCLIAGRLPFGSTSRHITGQVVERFYGDGTQVECTVMSDTLTLAGVSIPNQHVCVATVAKFPSTAGISGMIGLGPPRRTDSADVFSNMKTTFNDSMVSFYYNRQVIPVTPKDLIPDAGEVTFGTPNAARYTGDFNWFPSHPTDPHWAVTLSSIEVNGKIVTQNKHITAMIDTGTTLVILDEVTFRAINIAMDGVRQGPVYVVDCAKVKSFPPVIFTFGKISIVMPWDQQYFVFQNKYCISVFSYIEGGSMASATILGAWFLRNHYVVFDYGGARIGLATPVGDVVPVVLPPGGRSGGVVTRGGGGWGSVLIVIIAGMIVYAM